MDYSPSRFISKTVVDDNQAMVVLQYYKLLQNNRGAPGYCWWRLLCKSSCYKLAVACEVRKKSRLIRRGVSLMDVMAVGERRENGFPVEGFILVDEVSGHQMDRYLTDTDDEQVTNKLLTAYGRLIARLHQQGFYAPLRVKDLLISDVEKCELVMIDWEIRNPYPRVRSKRRAQRSLRDGFRRTRREFEKFNDAMEATVMSAYNVSAKITRVLLS